MKKIYPYLLLATACFVMFFWKLGATPITGLDEGLYAECSREMVSSGNYIVPMQNGEYFFDKPPLIYWLQCAGIHLFGINSFAVRLPSAVSALILVGLVLCFGSKLFGKRAGFLSAFVLTSSLLVVGLAHMCLLDQLFTLAITASLAAYLLAYTGLVGKWGYVAFWAAMGVSVMAKGPAGAVLILGTILAFLFIIRQPTRFFESVSILGLLVFFAIVLPWYILVSVQTHGRFLSEFFIHQNLQRAMGKDFQHNKPFYTYIPIYIVGFFPWSIFAPLAVKRHAKLKNTDRINDAPLFLTIWACVVIVIFSIIKSKLPSYILPSIPPSSLLVGLLWAKAVEEKKLATLKSCAAIASITSVIVGIAMQAGLHFLHSSIPGLAPVLVWMGIFLFAGAVMCLISLKINNAKFAFGSLLLGVGGFILVAICLGLPINCRTNAYPIYNIAMQIKKLPCNNTAFFSYRLSPPQPGISFYSQRFFKRTDDSAELQTAMENKHNCCILAQSDRLEGLPDGAKQVAVRKPYILYSVRR